MESKMIQLNLKIKDNLKEELEKEAQEKGLSLAGYIRMILYNRGDYFGKRED